MYLLFSSNGIIILLQIGYLQRIIDIYKVVNSIVGTFSRAIYM